MAAVDYTFTVGKRVVDGSIEVTDGDPEKPVVVLLHGTGGSRSDMISPGASPDNNYDYTRALAGTVTVGWRDYPGVGVWSCCELDDNPKKTVRSWREALSQYKFRTAVYKQVDPSGFLDAPARELAVVMQALVDYYKDKKQDPRFVLLAHSRGGLLCRKYLKDNPRRPARISHLITLHAPHTGSELASIAAFLRAQIENLEAVIGSLALAVLGWMYDMARSDAYQEMAVGSAFLADLANGEGPQPGIEYFTFGGTSVLLTRITSWVYTLGSALPQWHLPPFLHERAQIEVAGISPVANSLPNIIDELSDGRGDLLTADRRTRLPFATHQTNPINHAEALWDPTLQAQVLRILGIDVPVPPKDEPVFWW
jgi:pimeloyl-ACP methyl ester carboxylesterase